MTKTTAERRQSAEQTVAVPDHGTDAIARRRRMPAAGGVIADVPQSELTPAVRSTVMQLMDELDRMSGELLEAKQRVSELEDMADEDPLVPVLNRRGFLRELGRTLAYSERYQTPGSMIFCDLDQFKCINDDYGHRVGDDVLRLVADTLVQNVRRSDIVGRLGGDEFAVVLQRATAEQAQIKADEFMERVSEQPLIHEGSRIAVSISAGVAGFERGDTVVDVMERADRAMYRRKQERRG